jgi:ABC-2 type transport system permease protein
MNTQSNALADSFEAQRTASAVLSATHPLYWCIRRELEENRWIFIGQLIIAALFLLGFLISGFHAPAQVQAESPGGPAQHWHSMAMPYDMAAGLMMAALILMSLFYSADALHGERRDRSILFWKSLPVSDLTTVLAKASVPLIFLPLLTFVVTVAMQTVMLLLDNVHLAARGMSVSPLWGNLSVPHMWWLLLYHLVAVHALWPFPVYCWVLLVSGWARRAVLLWAALPVLAFAAFEELVLGTSHLAATVAARLIGGGAPSDITPEHLFPLGPMTHLTPGRYLSSPGLWIGLGLAALFLAAAAQLRRYRGSI